MSANILKNQMLLNIDGIKSNNPDDFQPFKV